MLRYLHKVFILLSKYVIFKVSLQIVLSFFSLFKTMKGREIKMRMYD